MDNEKFLHFVAGKIEDTRAAIFYCHSKSPLRIPNTIIHNSKMDDNGNISFLIIRPQQLISQFEQEFPVELNYFKKGKEYFLNIFGKARIINDPEELTYQLHLTTDEIESALTTHVLIRVKILKVDFYDNNYEKKNLFLKKIQSLYYRIFDSVGAASRSYNFEPGSALQHFGF